MAKQEPTILIQNYHPAATAALIRDFKKIGFRVVCPNSDWGCISYFSPNNELGGDLISLDEYIDLPSGHLLIACKPQETDLLKIALAHNDTVILNVAQHFHEYKKGISRILLCPDILTFEIYSEPIEHKILYFPKPYLSNCARKDLELAYLTKLICSYISVPEWWPRGTSVLQEFVEKYPYDCRQFGHGAPDGLLAHSACNTHMIKSFFTVHFKEQEAYGLSCLESMLLGTPIVSLREFMHDKTLGRFFLNGANCILADSVDEAISRINSITFEEYTRMSEACRESVLFYTRDAVTTEALRRAVWS